MTHPNQPYLNVDYAAVPTSKTKKTSNFINPPCNLRFIVSNQPSTIFKDPSKTASNAPASNWYVPKYGNRGRGQSFWIAPVRCTITVSRKRRIAQRSLKPNYALFTKVWSRRINLNFLLPTHECFLRQPFEPIPATRFEDQVWSDVTHQVQLDEMRE